MIVFFMIGLFYIYTLRIQINGYLWKSRFHLFSPFPSRLWNIPGTIPQPNRDIFKSSVGRNTTISSLVDILSHLDSGDILWDWLGTRLLRSAYSLASFSLQSVCSWPFSIVRQWPCDPVTLWPCYPAMELHPHDQTRRFTTLGYLCHGSPVWHVMANVWMNSIPRSSWLINTSVSL